MCRHAPNQACEKLRLSTRLGLQVKQSKQDASASLCAPRHKLTCRKKAVMTATASLLMPPVSASRTRAKRSRPAASPEKDGKGKVKHCFCKRHQAKATSSSAVLLLQALPSLQKQAPVSQQLARQLHTRSKRPQSTVPRELQSQLPGGGRVALCKLLCKKKREVVSLVHTRSRRLRLYLL